MTHTGIVGNGADKFMADHAVMIGQLITRLLSDPPGQVLVSGRSPVGGIDVWAEDIAKILGVPTCIYPPKTNTWSTGYKLRNLQIAEQSDRLHVIVAANYPPGYRGRWFSLCYHCARRARENPGTYWTPHVKSGGCWTAIEVEKRGKPVTWHVVGESGIATFYGLFKE